MIAIIDYGVGNLRSVEKAFGFIGCEALVTSDPHRILEADAVVLPGVGAYAEAMQRLSDAGMAEPVKRVIAENKPFLGICLGLQLLFECSEEGSRDGRQVKGLGVFRGAIKQIPCGMNLKVPHMGWNSIGFKGACRLFNGIAEGSYVYFVHSFYLKAGDRDIVSATTEYGVAIDAAVSRGRVYATQFHPEKSGGVGLRILRNFAEEVYS